MKLAFFYRDDHGIKGYGCMQADQYEKLQQETQELAEKRRKEDPSLAPYEPVVPLAVLDISSICTTVNP